MLQKYKLLLTLNTCSYIVFCERLHDIKNYNMMTPMIIHFRWNGWRHIFTWDVSYFHSLTLLDGSWGSSFLPKRQQLHFFAQQTLENITMKNYFYFIPQIITINFTANCLLTISTGDQAEFKMDVIRNFHIKNMNTRNEWKSSAWAIITCVLTYPL